MYKPYSTAALINGDYGSCIDQMASELPPCYSGLHVIKAKH